MRRRRSSGRLARALEADVVVTSGGVSVGPHDLVRRVLARLGVEEVFWGVAMRPGKPVAFGTRGATLAFGLPGNPVSSLVGCLLFVRPALLALQGHPDPAPPFAPASSPGRSAAATAGRLLRARVLWDEAGPQLDPIVGQESHMIVRATPADAIVHIPRGAEPLSAGDADPVSPARLEPVGVDMLAPRPFDGTVAARRERAELHRDGGKRDQDDDGGPRDEAEGHQRDDVQGSVEAEAELGADGDEGEDGACEARAVEDVANRPGGLRQPQPGVQRGEDEDEPVGADESGRDGDGAEGDERHRIPGERLLRRCGCRRPESGARAQPAQDESARWRATRRPASRPPPGCPAEVESRPPVERRRQERRARRGARTRSTPRAGCEARAKRPQAAVVVGGNA